MPHFWQPAQEEKLSGSRLERLHHGPKALKKFPVARLPEQVHLSVGDFSFQSPTHSIAAPVDDTWYVPLCQRRTVKAMRVSGDIRLRIGLGGNSYLST
jgi:hypothetical protein